MREPIENEYFNWLCAKVLETTRNNAYLTLLLILHKTEFVSVVHADTHRAMDGVDLRRDFLREVPNELDQNWFDQPASVLEVFISFAKRAWFQTDVPVKDWFWEFLTNLHLEEYRQVSDRDIPVIENILYTFIMRTYDYKGNGGMFPLSQTNNDQREVEIWYQFCEWVNEKGLF